MYVYSAEVKNRIKGTLRPRARMGPPAKEKWQYLGGGALSDEWSDITLSMHPVCELIG